MAQVAILLGVGALDPAMLGANLLAVGMGALDPAMLGANLLAVSPSVV